MRRLLVHVNRYADPDITLVSISPSVWLVLELPPGAQGLPVYPTKTWCSHCHSYVQGSLLPAGEELLTCGCLAVVCRSTMPSSHVLNAWRALRNAKRRVEQQLASVERN